MKKNKILNGKNILRAKSVGVIVFVVSLVFAGSFIYNFGGGILDSFAAVYANMLVLLTNRDRVSQNISELKVNPLLEKAAQLKADDMASRSYFAHNTPEGKTPWYWLEQVGYRYLYAGENLAVNFAESEDVQKAWMSSPSHKSNIVNPKFTEIGIATSTGIYKGREAVFVVQMFGAPVK